MVSEEPGLGSQASGTQGPGLLCHWPPSEPEPGRSQAVAGSRGRRGGVDTGQSPQVWGVWPLVRTVSLSAAQCQAGGGGWSQCHYHWHLSSPCSVQCQCQEPRLGGDPPGVTVSGVTVSFPDIRV